MLLIVSANVTAQNNEWRKKMQVFKMDEHKSLVMGLSVEDRMIKKGERVSICIRFAPSRYTGFSIPGVGECSKEELAAGEWYLTVRPDKTTEYQLVMRMKDLNGGKDLESSYPLGKVVVAEKELVLSDGRPILIALSTYEPIKPGETVEMQVVFDPQRVKSLVIPGVGEATKEQLAEGKCRFTLKPDKTTTYFVKAKILYMKNKPPYDKEYLVEIPVGKK